VSVLHDDTFRGFVVARQNALLRTGYLLTGDQGMAEDLVQTALEKTLRRWSGVGEPASLEAYVRRVMYREQVSHWRRRRVVEVPSAELPEWRRETTQSDAVEDHLVLQRALMRIGIRQRTVLVLRYFEDLSEQQVADVLGLSLGTVKSQAHRGLARLREAFGDLEPALGGGSL
jgi:RNA polymerase sigma-70 factor (sigma-E family)